MGTLQTCIPPVSAYLQEASQDAFVLKLKVAFWRLLITKNIIIFPLSQVYVCSVGRGQA